MRHGCCVMVDDRVYKFHMHLMYGLTLAKRGRVGVKSVQNGKYLHEV